MHRLPHRREAAAFGWPLRLALLAAAVLGASCGRLPEAQPPPTAISASDLEMERTSIERMLDDWHAAAAAGDEARYFGHLDESSVFLGTDATERWNKTDFKAFAHPFFARGHAWSFRTHHRHVMFGPVFGQVAADRLSIAWFDEQLDTPNMGPARGSGVVVKRDGGAWLIAHYNLTLTVPNEHLKEVKQLLEEAK